MKICKLIVIALSSMCVLYGCNSTKSMDDSLFKINTTEVDKPGFKQCEAAIGFAYRNVDKLKTHVPPLNINFDGINVLLANASSQMQNKNYVGCVASAQAAAKEAYKKMP